MNDNQDANGGNGDFSMASSSMPDRGTDAMPAGIDQVMGTAHRDASSNTAQGTDWSDVTGRTDTAYPNDGPLTADYEDLDNPGTTTLDEEFAASGDS